MKRLIMILAFLCIALPAFAMRVGDVDGNIDGMSQVIYDSGELASALTNLTISGLNSDDDGAYEIFMRIKSDGGTQASYYVYFNGDYGSNYGYQYMRGENAVTEAKREGAQSRMRIESQPLTTSGVMFTHMIVNAAANLSKTAMVSVCGNVINTKVAGIDKQGFVWNNTDELTSITFGTNVADAYGIGSRIIIMKKNESDIGMRYGDLSVNGNISGSWTLVTEQDIDTAVTNLTISGLSGDEDILYRLSANLSSNAVTETVRIRFNGDNNNANYGYQRLSGSNASVAAARDAANVLGLCYADSINSQSFGVAYIYAKSGYVRSYVQESLWEISGTTINSVELAGQVWNNTADEITSITLGGSDANGIGVNTHIELWKLRLAEGDT